LIKSWYIFYKLRFTFFEMIFKHIEELTPFGLHSNTFPKWPLLEIIKWHDITNSIIEILCQNYVWYVNWSPRSKSSSKALSLTLSDTQKSKSVSLERVKLLFGLLIIKLLLFFFILKSLLIRLILTLENLRFFP